MPQTRTNRSTKQRTTAVQVTPEEDRILEPEQARKFLETYFQKVADITIYWGSGEDFISDLYQKWHWNS